MRVSVSLLFVVLFSLITACSGDKRSQPLSTDNSSVSPNVIYGKDNRLDIYEVKSADWLKRASSTVALMSSTELTKSNSSYQIDTINYGSSQGLCKNEPYYNQGVAGFCSGSLIGKDIILTAGHCVRSASSCKTTKFVFNFSVNKKGAVPSVVSEDDVYSCKELIHSELSGPNKSDYALVRLDRAVVGRDPLPIRQSGSIADSEGLTVIGHPTGLPTKVADGANVRTNSDIAFFVANLDTYGGNSGSAVFNSATGIIEGILVRGENDFVYKNGCYVSNVCKDSDCRGEDVTRVTEILSHVDVSELASLPRNEEEVVSGEEHGSCHSNTETVALEVDPTQE